MPLNMTLAEATVPESTVSRPTEPNPFEGTFPLPEGKAVSTVLPSGKVTEKDGKTVRDDAAKDVEKAVSLAQEAGRKVDTTTRTKREPCTKDGKPDPKGDHTLLTFWTVPRITRPRKGTETGDAAPTNTENK